MTPSIADIAAGLIALNEQDLRDIVRRAAPDIARLGQWPAHIDPQASLTDRIPQPQQTASGFDAGIAAALGLMPDHAKPLCATLHAAYTEAAVEELRGAISRHNGLWTIKDAQSATCWWLAACSLCIDGEEVDIDTLRQQITGFAALAADDTARKAAAEKTLNEMCSRFDTTRGYAYGEGDGCMQGAYIAGHDLAVMQARHYDVYFIGTFRPSLGLEDFGWSDAVDAKGRPRSGPVHGSRQFVKCASESELAAAVAQAQKYLKTPPAPAADKPHKHAAP